MKLNNRPEAEVIADLVTLTAEPGFVHAIAQICLFDNTVFYSKQLEPIDMSKLFNHDRLIRTEVTTLIGLMVRQPLDLTQPSDDKLNAYVTRTYELMEELHHSLFSPMHATLHDSVLAGTGTHEIWQGKVMREPIFYGPESAYSFQYRDLLPEKYRGDDEWLIKNKAFSIDQAQAIAHAICLLMDEKSTQMFAQAKAAGSFPKSWLPAFEFSPDEIAYKCGIEISIIQAFLETFTFSGDNSQFKDIGDFNYVAATPLLPTGQGTVLLFQHYAIYEALYESPFYWMWNDDDYRATAMEHRGAFTEQYSAKRLAMVFGNTNVKKNVNLYQGKDRVGEVDVLVVFGDRIIIVQAKSKKLTLEARKGNDGQLKKDFAAAIQKSYDQGWECANAIIHGNCHLEDEEGAEINLPYTITEVYIFNVVAEHYPALAFQVHEYLKYQATNTILPPLVMDVFLLDTMTEMLCTPLRLLSYIRMRLAVIEQVSLSHELTALAFHLRRNLWLDPKYGMVILEDSIATDLDTAMMVRRDGRVGARTPAGILTRMAGTLYERLISQIEKSASPAALELGFSLLSMNEDSSRHVHRGLHAIMRKAQYDGKRHDFTISNTNYGICFHCNPKLTHEALETLEHHCEKRKYVQHAKIWFGISVDPECNVQFAVSLKYPWSPSKDMDFLTKNMSIGEQATTALAKLEKVVRPKKTGRNDPCPCGSGRKFKKCCLSATSDSSS